MLGPKKIIILGPTGVGKTKLSLLLAQNFKSHIVSVDSRQCYKYLNIGTAKPTDDELDLIPHHNISELDPKETESAGRFLERVKSYPITDSAPTFFVGGSTLHIQSLLFGLNEQLPRANEARIAKLSEIAKKNPNQLLEQLQDIDPEYAKRVDGFNPQRVMRAIDVWMESGKPFSSFHEIDFEKPSPEYLVIGLTRPRNILYERVEKRIDKMISDGLVEEIKSLLKMGYSFSDPGLSGVGYKEFAPFFEHEQSLDDNIARLKTATRRYIKRQQTWFNRWKFVHWFNLEAQSKDELYQQVEQKITNFVGN